MGGSKIIREKVLDAFYEELIVKGIKNKEEFESPFLRIVDRIFVHAPLDMKFSITKLDTLSFLIIVRDNLYIYLEWSPERRALLTINDPNDPEKGEIIHTTLYKALEKIDLICSIKTMQN